MLGPIVLIILLHRQKPIAVSENLAIEVHGAIVFLLVYFKEIFSSLCLIDTSSATCFSFSFRSLHDYVILRPNYMYLPVVLGA